MDKDTRTIEEIDEIMRDGIVEGLGKIANNYRALLMSFSLNDHCDDEMRDKLVKLLNACEGAICILKKVRLEPRDPDIVPVTVTVDRGELSDGYIDKRRELLFPMYFDYKTARKLGFDWKEKEQ